MRQKVDKKFRSEDQQILGAILKDLPPLATSRLGFFCNDLCLYGDSGSTVVKVLRYKSEGRWFDPRWCHWNFSLT
jgi:hypothetical protein